MKKLENFENQAINNPQKIKGGINKVSRRTKIKRRIRKRISGTSSHP